MSSRTTRTGQAALGCVVCGSQEHVHSADTPCRCEEAARTNLLADRLEPRSPVALAPELRLAAASHGLTNATPVRADDMPAEVTASNLLRALHADDIGPARYTREVSILLASATDPGAIAQLSALLSAAPVAPADPVATLGGNKGTLCKSFAAAQSCVLEAGRSTGPRLVNALGHFSSTTAWHMTINNWRHMCVRLGYASEMQLQYAITWADRNLLHGHSFVAVQIAFLAVLTMADDSGRPLATVIRDEGRNELEMARDTAAMIAPAPVTPSKPTMPHQHVAQPAAAPSASPQSVTPNAPGTAQHAPCRNYQIVGDDGASSRPCAYFRPDGSCRYGHFCAGCGARGVPQWRCRQCHPNGTQQPSSAGPAHSAGQLPLSQPVAEATSSTSGP